MNISIYHKLDSIGYWLPRPATLIVGVVLMSLGAYIGGWAVIDMVANHRGYTEWGYFAWVLWMGVWALALSALGRGVRYIQIWRHCARGVSDRRLPRPAKATFPQVATLAGVAVISTIITTSTEPVWLRVLTVPLIIVSVLAIVMALLDWFDLISEQSVEAVARKVVRWLVYGRLGFGALCLVLSLVLPVYGIWSAWPIIVALFQESDPTTVFSHSVTLAPTVGVVVFGGGIAMYIACRLLAVTSHGNWKMLVACSVGLVVSLFLPVVF